MPSRLGDSNEEFLPNFSQSLLFEMFSPKFGHALIFVVAVRNCKCVPSGSKLTYKIHFKYGILTRDPGNKTVGTDRAVRY